MLSGGHGNCDLEPESKIPTEGNVAIPHSIEFRAEIQAIFRVLSSINEALGEYIPQSLIREVTNVLPLLPTDGIASLDDIRGGLLLSIKQILEKGGQFESFTNSHGNSLLHIAVRNGDKKVVSWLLENGHDVEVKNSIGFTPAYAAVASGKIKVDIFIELIHYGCNLTETNDYGMSCVDLAAKFGTEKTVFALQYLASYRPRLKILFTKTRTKSILSNISPSIFKEIVLSYA